jgi:polyribonucleotide nucleotidyltransferase
VAGISVGLVVGDDGQYKLLTDIQGAEDHYGDMDFKVAGTASGITAMQVDIKVKCLTPQMIEAAVMSAREARLRILDVMVGAIAQPRTEVSEYAPKLLQTTIPQESIGSIIGPGGKTIRRLEEETEASIDVAEDGTITVGALTTEGAKRAIQMIKDLTGDIEVGRQLLGKVARIFNFGAMVEIVPGKEGLVPTYELAEEPVNRVEDVVSVGDDIMVMVVEIDHMGRINLSRRAVLQGLSPQETLATAKRPERSGPRRGGRRDAQRDGGRDRGPRRGGRRYD